jgi:hypothetical protein
LFHTLLFYLQRRLEFIRNFYNEASSPFVERGRKINEGEEPFEPPPYSGESGDEEPPFFDQWLEAEQSLDVLGQMCISVLSTALELYLSESLDQVGISLTKQPKACFKKGWINCCRVLFKKKLGIDWTTAPSSISVLEEIVLARNRAQHPDTITTPEIRQSDHDASKYPRSFFADESDIKLLEDTPAASFFLLPWHIKVTREKLLSAIDEVDRFCTWLEDEIQKLRSQTLKSIDDED